MDEPATVYEPPCAVHAWNPTVRFGLLGCICRDPLDLVTALRDPRAAQFAIEGPIYGGFRPDLPVSYRGLDLRTTRLDVDPAVFDRP